ncbi:hypothetical protein ABC733_03610 [Mangrovibacter sp. SLW1]
MISLGLPPEIVGQAGNTTTVTAVVKSKYGVERVEWDASELIAKGVILTSTEHRIQRYNLRYHLTTQLAV